MPYAFKPHHTLAHDARAVALRQLARAEGELVALGDANSDRAVHDARRHMKKLLALIRLLKPVLGPEFRRARRPLRRASRMLASLADAESLIATADLLETRRGSHTVRTACPAVRDALSAREAEVDRNATFTNVLPRAARLLGVERERVKGWALNLDGFDALAPGLVRSVKRTRRAMARAAAHPTHEAFHTWRRRVKDLWFQARLLDGCCARALTSTCGQLEELDGLLGDYRNMVLLEAFLLERPCLTRQETARALRVLRRRRKAIARDALHLGSIVLRDPPDAFVARVAEHWKAAPGPSAGVGSPSCHTA